jgi:arsenite methyltransferase
MTTTPQQLDTTELEQRVKSMYQEVALEPERDFHFETGQSLAERLGYPAGELDRIRPQRSSHLRASATSST